MAKRKAEQSKEARATKRPRQDRAGVVEPTKSLRKGKAWEAAPPAPPAAPKARRINQALKNKVKQVGDFLDLAQGSVLSGAEDNENHVVARESAVLGALMAMRGDWELSDPRMASLLDVQEAIVEEYELPVGTLQVPAKYVVLDLDAATSFNDGIQFKIRGHGLEGINLVEVELEMYERQERANMAMILLDAFIDAGSDSEDDEPEQATGNDKPSTTAAVSLGSLSSATDPTTNKPMNETVEKASFDTTIITDKETNSIGVCPAPIKDL